MPAGGPARLGRHVPAGGSAPLGRPGQVWRGKPWCVKPDHAEQSAVSQAPLLALAAARHYNPVKMSSCPKAPRDCPLTPSRGHGRRELGFEAVALRHFSRTHPRTLCMDAECISIWCLLPHPSLREH